MSEMQSVVFVLIALLIISLPFLNQRFSNNKEIKRLREKLRIAEYESNQVVRFLVLCNWTEIQLDIGRLEDMEEEWSDDLAVMLTKCIAIVKRLPKVPEYKPGSFVSKDKG